MRSCDWQARATVNGTASATHTGKADGISAAYRAESAPPQVNTLRPLACDASLTTDLRLPESTSNQLRRCIGCRGWQP